MSKPSVLIVGAGAVGLAVGYHLSLAEASITFLVRPGRSAACASPQHLYCYDDAELKTFAGYSVVENVAELAEMRFQFVIVTLDGRHGLAAQPWRRDPRIRCDGHHGWCCPGPARALPEGHAHCRRSVTGRLTRHAQPSGQCQLARPRANRS